MSNAFANSLSELVHSSVEVLPYSLDEGTYGNNECGAAPLHLIFPGEVILRMDYWRLIEGSRSTISSFDHRQQYGLPSRIDAVTALQKILNGKLVTSASADSETGDLRFQVDSSLRLQVFNFTGYGISGMKFPDGTVEYSNYFEKGS